jgi:thiamine-phosphate pyrophosphorylase
MKEIFTGAGRLYLVTDRTISGLTHTEIVKKAVRAGIRTVQMREKDLPKKEILTEALRIRDLTLKHKVRLIINDHVDIARMVNADGVHLGQDDMPIREARRILGRGRIIGISTHNKRQAVEAQESGADYIGFGPVFCTETKKAGSPKGIKGLAGIRKLVRIPIVAIGGITIINASDITGAGSDAVAVASAILSGDIIINIKKFMSVIGG